MDNLLTAARPASPAKQRRLARREGRVWRRADGYVAITRTLGDEMSSRFGPRQRVAVIPDGARVVDDAELHVSGTSENAPDGAQAVIGYAGHLYPWKGVHVLLEALVHVPGARAVIVGGMAGESDLDRLKRRARELDVDRRVDFVGQVAPPRVAAHLRRARVLVLPNTATDLSSRYTSPLKLFEYMASARPIVASDLPSLREVLRDGENALLVPAGDARGLAAAVRRLFDDPALALRLAASAKRDAAAYSWERRAERIEALMEEVVTVPHGARSSEGQGT